MTLAETASTFCETLVTDAALAASTQPGRGAVDPGDLPDRRHAGGGGHHLALPVRAGSLRAPRPGRAFGRRLLRDHAALPSARPTATGWTRATCTRICGPGSRTTTAPTCRSTTIPYAFGLLFGIGLYALYQARGPAFVPEYEALLGGTGEASPVDLAARFGIDLRQPEFWQASLRLIEQRIDRYLQL